MTKSSKQTQLEQQVAELTADLQRNRADFENYLKRVEAEKLAAKTAGQTSIVIKLLPIIDNIERAISHIPKDLKDNSWAQGVAGIAKNLEQSLESIGIKRIESSAGTVFNPQFHEAIQFEEDAKGDQEVVAEELQAGYTLNGQPIRHAMVKVTRQ